MSHTLFGAQRSVTAALRLKSPARPLRESPATTMDPKTTLGVAVGVFGYGSDNPRDKSVYDPEDVDPFNAERTGLGDRQLTKNSSFSESVSSYSVASSYPSSPEIASPLGLMASISEMVDGPDYFSHSAETSSNGYGSSRRVIFNSENGEEKRQSLVENSEVQSKINRVFELARTGGMDGEEMRALVEELEDYYSRPASRIADSSIAGPSESLEVDNGLHDYDCRLSGDTVNADPTALPTTDPDNALGLCTDSIQRAGRSPSRPHRASRIPRFHLPASTIVKAPSLNALRKANRESTQQFSQVPNHDQFCQNYNIGDSTTQPARIGLGLRSFSNPEMRTGPDCQPTINHARTRSVRSFIPRRVEPPGLARCTPSVKLDVSFDFEPSYSAPPVVATSRFSVSTVGPSPRPDGFKRIKPSFSSLAKYRPPPSAEVHTEKIARHREKRYGFVPMLSKALSPDHRNASSKSGSRIPRKPPPKVQPDPPIAQPRETVEQLPLPDVSGRWSTNWDDVMMRIENSMGDGDGKAVVLRTAVSEPQLPVGCSKEMAPMGFMLPRGQAQIRKASVGAGEKTGRRIGRFFSGINWSMPSLSSSRSTSRSHTPVPPLPSSHSKSGSRPTQTKTVAVSHTTHLSITSVPITKSKMPVPITKASGCQVLLPSILSVLDASIDNGVSRGSGSITGGRGKGVGSRGMVQMLRVASRLSRSGSGLSRSGSRMKREPLSTSTDQVCGTPLSLAPGASPALSTVETPNLQGLLGSFPEPPDDSGYHAI